LSVQPDILRARFLMVFVMISLSVPIN